MNGDVVFPDVVLAHGVVQKTHDGYAAEEDHEADLKRGIAPQGGIDAVEREKSHDELDDPLGNSGPYTGVRLAVVFFHDLVNFCRRNGLKLAECRRAVNFYLVRRSFGSRRILFLEQGHTRTILSFQCFVGLGSAELNKAPGIFVVITAMTTALFCAVVINYTVILR